MCIKIFFLHFFHLNSWYADAARQVSMLTFLCLLPEASVQVLMSTFASFLFLYDRSEMLWTRFYAHGMGWNREIQMDRFWCPPLPHFYFWRLVLKCKWKRNWCSSLPIPCLLIGYSTKLHMTSWFHAFLDLFFFIDVLVSDSSSQVLMLTFAYFLLLWLIHRCI